jgi:hypothetical protein
MSEDSDRISFSLRAVAVFSLFTALAAVTALVVVVGTDDPDALTVTALALAVLSFLVQLLLHGVQTVSAARQEDRFAKLYSGMESMLGRIVVQSETTGQTITTLNERVIEHVLTRAIEDRSGDTSETLNALSAQRLAHRVTRMLAQAQGDELLMRQLSDSSEARPDWLDPLYKNTFDSRDARLRADLTTFPTVDHLPAMTAVVENLGSDSLRDMARLAHDEEFFRRPGSHLKPGVFLSLPAPLLHLGLVNEMRDAAGWFELTERGRIVARMYTAGGEVPQEWRPTVEAFRTFSRNELGPPIPESTPHV